MSEEKYKPLSEREYYICPECSRCKEKEGLPNGGPMGDLQHEWKYCVSGALGREKGKQKRHDSSFHQRMQSF